MKTLEEVAAALAAPFDPGEERYRVGATWGDDNNKKGKPVGYIRAKNVMDRLDAVVGPGNWSMRQQHLGPGAFLCSLTVLGVTMDGVGQAGAGDEEPEKSGASDALKRAAVLFGIGRYLADLDLPGVPIEKKGKSWVLPQGYKPPGAKPSSPPPTSPKLDRPTPQQVARIGREVKRLGWTSSTARDWLASNFNGAQSREELTQAQAGEAIHKLEALAVTAGGRAV